MGKIILLDGAQGTRLWEKAGQQGVEKDPVWKYNMEHPDFVAEVAKEYAEAGSEIVCANTFGANRLAVERSSSYAASEVVEAGVRIAKEALAGTGVKAALDIGPLSVMMEPYGDLEEDEAAEIFDEMLAAGAGAGADMVFFETFMDVEMMRVAAESAMKYDLPVICSMTFEKGGRTMMGNRVEDIVETLAPLGIAGIGMNCSLGPAAAGEIIRQYAAATELPLFLKPNAGLPESGEAEGATPEGFARLVAPVLDRVTYLGGCCGTSPDFIRELKKLI
ncbi:MAG: homocysteine S-methyltransferase family protein [Oscillospiraceae bacterium]|nr:homocysteine S-methyltransferase family protein [Oscillospiraceae bacterium]